MHCNKFVVLSDWLTAEAQFQKIDRKKSKFFHDVPVVRWSGIGQTRSMPERCSVSQMGTQIKTQIVLPNKTVETVSWLNSSERMHKSSGEGQKCYGKLARGFPVPLRRGNARRGGAFEPSLGIPTPLKNMTSWVGMMNIPIYGEINLFQTTNQICVL